MREKVIEAIERYAKGEPIKPVLADLMIRPATFYEMKNSDPVLTRMFEIAREAKAEMFADEIVTIADDESRNPQQARNAIDARKWAAAKLFPKVFSDRIDMNIAGQIDLTAALAEARARALPQPARNLEVVTDADYEELQLPSARRATDAESVAPPDDVPNPFDD